MDASRREIVKCLRLHPEDLELLARRVADLIQREPAVGFVDTAAVARLLSVSEEWVRAHSAELGAVRIGDGPRGALRFDIDQIRAVVEARRSERPALRPVSRRGRPRRSAVELLPLPGDPK